MASTIDDMSPDNQTMSDTSSHGYESSMETEGFDYPMSDASSVLSEPPLEMDLGCDLDPGMDLDSALEFHRRMSSTPSDEDGSIGSVRSPTPSDEEGFTGSVRSQRRPAPLPLHRTPPDVDSDEDPESESDSDSDVEDSSFEANNSDAETPADDSTRKVPFEEFFSLKPECEVSKFEGLPYEVARSLTQQAIFADTFRFFRRLLRISPLTLIWLR